MSLILEPHDSAIVNDAEMVEACQKGNLDAFEWLVRKYQNPAIAIALSYVSNFHDAQEIVQEAFLKAYCKLIGHQGVTEKKTTIRLPIAAKRYFSLFFHHRMAKIATLCFNLL